MLSSCANPECSAPFQYLREGRLYKFELTSGPQLASNRKSSRKVEHFWLCGQCAATMTLVLRDQQKVVVVPRKNTGLRRAAGL